MDFDDMPDSYFAFLSNQRKLAEPDKINGAMKDLSGRTDSSPGGSKSKVKSRASQPQMAGAQQQGSKPSVPSLPSIQRTSTQPAKTTSSGPQSGPFALRASGSKPPSRPQLGAKPPSSPQLAAMSMRMQQNGNLGQPRSNALVFILVGVLVAAIAVLGYLVLTK
jgi:cobalamin biosynthesis Mg chelatase CobN